MIAAQTLVTSSAVLGMFIAPSLFAAAALIFCVCTLTMTVVTR